ncbi:hypothetical protein KIPB_009004, partial [Kipferlia bialata]|eukprot:g9004.t1
MTHFSTQVAKHSHASMYNPYGPPAPDAADNAFGNPYAAAAAVAPPVPVQTGIQQMQVTPPSRGDMVSCPCPNCNVPCSLETVFTHLLDANYLSSHANGILMMSEQIKVMDQQISDLKAEAARAASAPVNVVSPSSTALPVSPVYSTVVGGVEGSAPSL